MIKKVNRPLGIFEKYLFVNVSINPVASAIVIPIKASNNVPKGAKLIKLVVALPIINFIPSKLSKFSTATNVGSNSFVFGFTILYVACISKADNIPLATIVNMIRHKNTVIG